MDKRDGFITIRLTDHERSLIEQRAEARRQKPSTYARDLIFTGMRVEDSLMGSVPLAQGNQCGTKFDPALHGPTPLRNVSQSDTLTRRPKQ